MWQYCNDSVVWQYAMAERNLFAEFGPDIDYESEQENVNIVNYDSENSVSDEYSFTPFYPIPPSWMTSIKNGPLYQLLI